MNKKKNKYCELNILTNEDTVEKFFVDKLLKDLQYPDKCIKVKTSIKELIIGKGSKKNNYKPDYVLLKAKLPFIVIDAKHPKEKIDDYIFQTSGYSLALNQSYSGKNPVQYFILTNGLNTKLYRWDDNTSVLTLNFDDFDESNIKFKRLIELLSYNSKEKIEFQDFIFKKLDTNKIEGIFKACHNLIWKKETISPTKAFYEFSKLFFIKLKQDKDIHKKYHY